MTMAGMISTLLPRRRMRIAGVMLLAYFAVLVQPCALAMGSGAGQPADHCHPDSATETVACMSQPSLDCATDDLLADARDLWKPLYDTPVLTPDFDSVIQLPADLVAGSAYFGRAPPPGTPPLHVRHCVYLK